MTSSTEIIPDGGWGWVVCLGTFIVAFIVEGTTAAFGVIILPIQSEFNASKSSTTWVASLSFGVCYLIGPLVGILLEKFSYRQVTIGGTLIGFCSFTVSAFAPNIYVLIISYGIFGGISMGITFMAAVVAVGRYFDKRRAIATGIAMSGAGFGMFAYPFVVEILLQFLNWRDTILLMSAVYLHCAVSGSLFRPLHAVEVFKLEDCIIQEETYQNQKPLKPPVLSKIISENVYHSLPQINSNEAFSADSRTKTQSLECVKQKHPESCLSNGLSKKDVYSSGFMQISCDTIHLASGENVTEKTRYKQNLHVLKDPQFIIVLFVMVSWSVQYICTLYIPDFAFSNGIPKAMSALLVSIIGVTNTLGRFMSGFIVDFLHVRSITLYFTAFVVVTIGTFVLPLCVTFWQIAIYSVVSGLCVGIFTGMRTIVIVDFVGIQYLSHAYGWVSFFQGVSSIPAPPIAGAIYDASGSYKYTFIMVACFYLGGCATSLLLKLSNSCFKCLKR